MNIKQIDPNHYRFVDEPEPPDKSMGNSKNDVSQAIDIQEEVVAKTQQVQEVDIMIALR